MKATFLPAGAALQRQPMRAKNAKNALAIDWRQPCRPALPIQKRGNATVTVGRAGIDQTTEDRQQVGAFGLAIGSPSVRCPRCTRMELGTAHAEHLGHPAHREPSFGSDGRCQVCFFTCAFAQALVLHLLAAEEPFEVADALLELADLGGADHRLVRSHCHGAIHQPAPTGTAGSPPSRSASRPRRHADTRPIPVPIR